MNDALIPTTSLISSHHFKPLNIHYLDNWIWVLWKNPFGFQYLFSFKKGLVIRISFHMNETKGLVLISIIIQFGIFYFHNYSQVNNQFNSWINIWKLPKIVANLISMMHYNIWEFWNPYSTIMSKFVMV